MRALGRGTSRFFCSLVFEPKCSSSAATPTLIAAAATDLITTKCDYVKVLYGYSKLDSFIGKKSPDDRPKLKPALPPPTSSLHCRLRQAASTALQNYLHFRRAVPLDDAVFISSAAPRFTDALLHRLASDQDLLTLNYEQARSRIEGVLLKEGIDEMEPFLESIGADSSRIEVVGDLCGEQGLLRTAKALEKRGIPKPVFWGLLRHNPQLLNYTLRDCLDALAILSNLGLTPETMAPALRACPGAFRVEIEEELRPLLEQLQRLGIDRRIIARIIAEAPGRVPSLAALNVQALLAAIESAGVPREFAGRIIESDPLVLVAASIAKVQQLVDYFTRELLLEEPEMTSIVMRFPRVLALNLERSVVSKVEFLRQMGVERAYIKQLLVKTPQVLSFSLEENLKPKVEFLESIGFKRKGLAGVLARHPMLLNDIASSCLRRKANFLIHYGVPVGRLADIFYLYPDFAGLRLEDVKRRFDFYHGLRVDRQTLGTMIAKHPRLMGYDVEKRVRPVVEHLQEELGLDQAQVVEFLRERPAVLAESVESLKGKVEYFEKLGLRRGSEAFGEILAFAQSVPREFMESRMERLKQLGITDAELKRLVQVRMPLLYRDDRRMLASTEYLIKDMGLSMDFLLRFPQFFGYSLEQRLKPRHRLIAFLKAKRVVKQDYPASYMHMSVFAFEELFLNSHPQARDVYSGLKDPQLLLSSSSSSS